MDDQATLLSQRVEREVRFLIGDLQMQVLVLRQMMELTHPQQPNPQPGQQHQPPRPQPNPPQPERPEDKPPPQAMNGRANFGG